MNQKMLDLIDTVIGDGELEQEEIDYLKEKATEYGESPIEVVSLAKTMLKQQEGKRKESFEGEVKKCPHCGEPIKGIGRVCGNCNYVFSTSAESLSDLIEEYEGYIVESKIPEYERRRAAESKSIATAVSNTDSSLGKAIGFLTGVFSAETPASKKQLIEKAKGVREKIIRFYGKEPSLQELIEKTAEELGLNKTKKKFGFF